MIRWFIDNRFGGGTLLALAIAGGLWLMWWAIQEEAVYKQEFMDECLQDKKQYECTAMWRAGEKDNNTIIMYRP